MQLVDPIDPTLQLAPGGIALGDQLAGFRR